MRPRPRSPAAPEPRSGRGTIALAGSGLVLAALAVYANSFSGPFIFDDLLSIPQNPTLHRLTTALAPPGGGVTVTGRPLLNLSFALNHALSGDQVWSYHVLNFLIHSLAGLTLFGIVRRTLAGPGANGGKPGAPASLFPGHEATFVAFAAALFWTVHPLQTESVTYIVQRAESLMGLFYLLTLYCFIRGVEIRERAGSRTAGAGHSPSDRRAGHERRPQTGVEWFALAFVFCLLGMATKEVMVTAPLIVLLYDRTFLAGSFRAAWQQRGRIYLALASTWILLAALVLLAANRGGSAGFGAGVSFWSYAATQFEALVHYLRLAVWPHPLIIDYGVQWVDSVGDVAPYAAVVVLLVAATVVALVRRPALGFLGAAFLAVLAPTSLVPVVRQTLAEHRMYLALAPAMVLLVLVLRAGLGRRVWFVVAAAAAGLGWLTVQRNTVYRSDAAIWQDTVAKRPGNAAARNNYGNILAQAGRPGEALGQYEEAIRINPDYAEAHHNAGNALTRLGRLPEAIACYERALAANPNMPDALTALGIALEDSGRGAEALARYDQALHLAPDYTDALNRLGLALARAGRLPEALAHYEQVLKRNPNLSEVHNNLGNVLRAGGRLSEAIPHYEQALRLRPDFAAAHHNLGRALAATDRLPEAIVHFARALEIDPAAPEGHNDLGMVLVMAGRAQEGVAHFEAALRLNPNQPQVHLNLAITLERVGRPGEAAAHYEAARRLGVAVPPPRN